MAARVWSKPNPGTPTWNDVAALIAEVERLRPMEEALRFYADEENHDDRIVRKGRDSGYESAPVVMDRGERARAALSPDTKDTPCAEHGWRGIGGVPCAACRTLNEMDAAAPAESDTKEE